MANKVLDSNRIYEGKILNLRVDSVEPPDGGHTKREIVEHKNGVGILPVDHAMMIFVQQYRDAVGSDLLEIPAGLVEVGEDPRTTASRELQEEIIRHLAAAMKERIFLLPINLKPTASRRMTMSLFMWSDFRSRPLEKCTIITNLSTPRRSAHWAIISHISIQTNKVKGDFLQALQGITLLYF